MNVDNQRCFKVDWTLKCLLSNKWRNTLMIKIARISWILENLHAKQDACN